MYYSGIHRLFHTKYLYKYHKVHHTYNVPIGFAAIYAHPLDYIFGNIVPDMVPFFLCCDYYTFHFLITIGVYITIMDHSNMGKYKHHIDHHRYFNCNYGATWIDKIMKTKRLKED